MKIKSTFLLVFLISTIWADSIFISKGQIIGSPGISYNNDFDHFASLQYIPIIEYQLNKKPFNYSTEIAGNFFTNFKSQADGDLYRCKITLSGQQTELRLGLQQLNFGPAQILRSLRWFDSISATDPLKITSGVWGALFRYYFLNNNNIWLWSLYGNEDIKGIEFLETKKNSFELGGRTQFMLFSGEMAFTYHHRELMKDSEDKIAVDGRWDYFIGSWFEGVYQTSNDFQTFMLTLGIDYTFGIGNGLYFLTEEMYSRLINDISSNKEVSKISSLMLSYPVTLFDNINAITYYSWPDNELSQFLGWQRVYDNFMFNVNLFHYPEKSTSANQIYSGYGIELKLIYNY